MPNHRAYSDIEFEARTARKEIAHATRPLDAEFLAWLGPVRTVELAEKTAAYVAEREAILPGLDAEAAEARKVQCYRCSGTGLYGAPTSRLRRGVPYCFTCGGSGLGARARKAAAAARAAR